jgi:hypothetical protein
MNFLWSLLNDLSFIMMLSFISISVPGLVQTIQQTFLHFIYMDLLQTSAWLPQLFFGSDYADSDVPLNDYFNLNGYSSQRTIENLGSTFVYLVILAFMHLLLLILRAAFFDCGQR